MNKRTLALVAAVPVTILTLAACGSSSSATGTGGITPAMTMPATSSSAMAGAMAHNNADITFALDMIPHHQQAVAMAKLAATRSMDLRVNDLAARIEAAQGPEITMMTGWLTSWNAPIPASSTGMDGMSGMGDTAIMPGMMSDADMTALAASSGATFDKAFLTMMITHHEGALTMAATELKSGSNTDAMALAQAIINGQTKEITEMKTILQTP
jgi:uncharacterized protein (DUF305 family)